MEIWSRGKSAGSIITDSAEGYIKENASYLDEDNCKYYGGILICESIARKKDVALICAAPDMFSALQLVVDSNFELPTEVKNAVKAAIEKATNLNFN